MREVQTEEELEQAIKESETRLMILDFFADWCGPCKRVAPELDKICEEWEDVLFVKLNVDELESAAETYAIAAMPTFIAFKGGEKVDEVVGANLDKLREMIEKYKARHFRYSHQSVNLQNSYHPRMHNYIYSVLMLCSVMLMISEAIVLTEKNRETLVDCLQTCQYAFMTCEYKCSMINFCKIICDKTVYECQKSCYIEAFNANQTL
ncbi:unnamed protein product [Schistosoma turkestanicum]|nr:unnamed protein product [Schistosoma turkestanicum]